jgi:hypothetical protein
MPDGCLTSDEHVSTHAKPHGDGTDTRSAGNTVHLVHVPVPALPRPECPDQHPTSTCIYDTTQPTDHATNQLVGRAGLAMLRRECACVECACVDDNESLRGGFNTSAMKLPYSTSKQNWQEKNKRPKRCQGPRTRQSGRSSDRQRATPRRLRVAHTRATTATPGRWRTRVC